MRAFAILLVVLAVVVAAAVIGSSGAGTDEAEAAPWTLAEPMSQRRSYIAAAQIGEKIYAAGGMVGETGRPLPLFEVYDPASGTWSILPRMPEAVRAAAAAAVGDVLYVIGGTTEAGNSRTVYAYDTATGTRSERAPA